MGAIRRAVNVLEVHQHIAPAAIAPLHNKAVDALEDVTSLAEHQKAAMRKFRETLDSPNLQNAEKLDVIDEILRSWKV